MICEIFDDLLEPHVAELIDMEIKKTHWKYDYHSNRTDWHQPHWHVFCGESEEEFGKDSMIIFFLSGMLLHINSN